MNRRKRPISVRQEPRSQKPWRGRLAPAQTAITWLTLALSGAGLCLLCWAFAHTDRTLVMRPRMLWLFFSAFGVFLVAVWAVRRARAELPPRLVWFIVLVGVVLRLAVAPMRPATTSDIYRYLWEGRVVRAGMNPYAEAPDSPRLAHLRDWTWAVLPFKSVPAAYPPVAQYVFAASGLIPGPPVAVLKLILALFDVGTVLLLGSLLAAMGLPRSWVILYSWHPLAICELVARGHLDTIGIFFMALALRLFGRSLLLPGAGDSRPSARAILSGAALGLSILAKGYALVIAPFLFLAARPRQRLFALAMLGIAALAYAPFASAGLDLFRGGVIYSRGWRGNSSIFALLDLALAQVSPAHNTIARAVCLTALLSWLGLLVSRARAERGLLPAVCRAGSPNPATLASGADITHFALLALPGFFLLSPAVYPWYLAWTLPLLCIAMASAVTEGRPPLHMVGWLLLTGTIFGFYAHDLAGHHREIWWVTTLEYGLPLLAAAIAVGRSRRWAGACFLPP